MHPSSPRGPGEGRRVHGGRARQRRRRRLWTVHRALLSLVAVCRLAGQSAIYRSSSPQHAFSRLVRASLRLAKGHPFIHLQPHTVRHTNSDDFDLPRWAKRLYSATNLGRTVAISRAWSQLLADSHSYAARCHNRRGNLQTVAPPTKLGSIEEQAKLSALQESMKGLSFCGYAVRGDPDPSLVSPLAYKKVSIPAAGHHPQPISRFLAWPWREIFSDEGYHRYLRDDTPVHTAQRAYDSFASERDRLAIYNALRDRNMLEYRPVGGADLGTNGMFGVTKPSGDLRVIGDLRPGNVPLISMAQLERLYVTMIEERGGDDAPELRRKALDLFNGTGLSSLPAGSVSKAECDLSDYFHFLLVPHTLSQHQRLAPVRAVSVGMDPCVHGEFVVPTLTTLVMGLRYATLLGQLVHERLLTPFLTRRVRFYLPEATPLSYRQAVGDLSATADDDGCVPLGSVPARVVAPLLHAVLIATSVAQSPHVQLLSNGLPSSLALVRVPVSLFHNLPAPPGSDPASCVLLRGWDIRDADLSVAMRGSPPCSSMAVDFLFMLYIDDHHDLIQGPCSAARSLGWLESLGNWNMLGSVVSCVRAGFCVRQQKLAWASVAPSKTLGIVIDLRGPHTIFYPCPIKLEGLVQVSWEIARRVGQPVRVGTVCRAVGLWVWGMLTRRLMLSVFRAVYHWMQGHSMSSRAVLPWAVAGEFILALSLAPSCYGIAAPFSPTVTAFDASGTGYGVSYRDAPPGVLAELSSRIERHGSWSAFETNEAGGVAPSRLVNRLDPSMARQTADWLLSGWDAGKGGWRIARAGAWEFPPKHITLGEISTSLIAGEHIGSQPRKHAGFRNIFIGDNQPSLGALSKGRSSNPAMCRVCRRWLALSVVAKLFPTWVYVRSRANPSDVGSRMYRWLQGRAVRVKQPKFSRPASEWIPDLTTHGDVENHPGPRSYWQGVRIKPSDIDFSGVLGLKLRSVTPATAAGYLTAILAFKRWIVATGHMSAPLDLAAARYVAWCHESGEVSKGQVSHLLCGVIKICPRFKKLGVLDEAWVAMQGWSRLAPTQSYLPVPQGVAFGCAMELRQRGQPGAAAAILTAFDGYLRSTDCCCLQCKDVAFRGDARLLNPATLAAVCLRYSKAQRDQWVTIRCVHAVAGLRLATAGKHPNDLVFGLRGDQLLALFKQAQVWLGYDVPPYRIHGLRGGGATHDRINDALSFLEIQLRGRWSGRKITLHYIHEAQAMLLQLDFPEAVKRKLAIVRAALQRGLNVLSWEGSLMFRLEQ